MLKYIVFSNIGLFRDKNVINCSTPWEGGLAILVGENGSGKTMATECIRRCLSSEISQTESTILDESCPSYAFCKFELNPESVRELLRDEAMKNIVECLEMSAEEEAKNVTCVSGMYIDAVSKYKYKFLELCFNSQKNVLMTECSNIQVKVNDPSTSHDEGQQTSQTKEKRHSFQYDPTMLLHDFVGKLMEVSKENEKEDTIGLFATLRADLNETEPKTFEYIYNELFGRDGCVHMIYPHHGIGPLPDTASPLMEAKQENYKIATKNANLLKRLWEKMLACTRIKDRYDEYLEQILPGCDYSFKIEKQKDYNDKIIMTDKTAGDKGSVDVLKAPEGILEIIIFCLCIAEKDNYTTVSYEEPTRSLHPTVTERLSSFIITLLKRNKICLILPTHSSKLGTYSTWEHIYHFKRIKESDSSTYLRCKRVHDPKNSIKVVRKISNEQMQKILFARKVLFVEGETDQILFSQLLDTLRVSQPCSDELLKKAVMNLTVVMMGGKDEAEKLAGFCGRIGVDYKILVDNDHTMNDDNKKLAEVAKSIRTFLNKLELDEDSKDCIMRDPESIMFNIPKKGTKIDYIVKTVSDMVNDLEKQMTTLTLVDKKPEHDQVNLSVGALKEAMNALIDHLKVLESTETNSETKLPQATANEIDIDDIVKTVSEQKKIGYDGVNNLIAMEKQITTLTLVDKKSKKGNRRKFYWSVGALEEAMNEYISVYRDENKPPRPLLIREKGHWKGKTRKKKGDKYPVSSSVYNTVWYLTKKPEEGYIKTFSMNEVQEVIDVLLKLMPPDLTRFLSFLEDWRPGPIHS